MTIEPIPQPARLYSLQALRGVAALLVVIFHAAAIWREISGTTGFPGFWDRGWVGVDLFFVISGFVMVWVAGDRTPGLRSAGRFLFDRATRIYPLWWIFCSLMALYFLISYGQPAAPDRESADGAWSVFVASMALWPQGEMPLLPVGWTLTFELAFYALFAVLLLIPPYFRGWVIGAWGVFLILIGLNQPFQDFSPNSWIGILVHPLCLEFVFGALIAYLVKSVSISDVLGRWFVAAGLVLSAGLLVSGFGYGGEGLVKMRVPVAGTIAAVMLLGLVIWERSGGLSVPRFLQVLGDASYTLYLSHFLVLLTLKRLLVPTGLFNDASLSSLYGFMAISTLASIVAALLLYRMVEKPLLTLSRAPLAKRRRNETLTKSRL